MKKMTKLFSSVMAMSMILLTALRLPASALESATIADYQSASVRVS